MRTNRSNPFSRGTVTVPVLLALGLAISCGGTQQTFEEPWPGVEEASGYLTKLAADCTYAADTGIATVTVAADEVAVISQRVIDSALIVNGYTCDDANGDAALATRVKKIAVNESGVGAVTVIMDYINGTFARGISGSAGVVVTFDTTAADAFKIRGSTRADTVTFGPDGIGINTDSYVDISVSGTATYTVSLGAGRDVLSAAGGYGTGDTAFTTAITAYGGDDDDTLTGGDGADTLYGGPGDDTLAGGAGADTLYGDEGDDTFDEGDAANGADTFNGGAGTDIVDYSARTADLTVTIDGTANDGDGAATENDDLAADMEGAIGGSGADNFTGSASADTFEGGAGDDTIDGGDGADTIKGGLGADTITGGLGDDTLYGDDGDDTFNEGSATSGADTIYGGSGTDLVNYGSRTNDLTISLNNQADDGESGELDNVRSDVENITGGAGADTITGSNYDNVIDGGAGDDTLDGASGNDTFLQGSASDGADTIIGGTGVDTVDYSSRTNALTVTMGDETANDGEAAETDDIGLDVEVLLCGDGDDTVTGNDLDNTIDGGAGDDTLSGGAGNDELYGGTGDGGDDTLNGGAGDDILDGGDSTSGDTLDCGAGTGDISIPSGGTNCEL